MTALAAVRDARRRRLRRTSAVIGAVGVLALLLVLASLSLGRPTLGPGTVLRAIAGSGDAAAGFIVVDLRLPRVVAAVLVGAAFGLAGAVFQAVLRNPLASPDIVGVTQGASAAAVVAVLSLGLVGVPVSLAALVGGVVVAAISLALAGRSGTAGSRFVLIGIAVAFLTNAVIGFLLTRADIRAAQGALVWLVGSLSSLPWDQLAPAAIAIAILAAGIGFLSPRLRVLQLGPELASGLGIRVGRTRLLLLAFAIALVGVGTALAGPIAFVALAAPPIARALVSDAGAALAGSALVGAAELVGADLVAQNALPDAQLPAGVVTGILGAPVLLLLLARRARSEAVTA
ncbi:MAG: iron ABC transporter permease [Micrococcales bacterium]|nr:iron ABC transporter permease [Micrococcales bacterium]